MDPNEIARARIDEILANADQLTDEGIVRSLRLLDELRKQVIVAIADASTDFGRFTAQSVLTAVDRAVDEFTRRYSHELAGLQARAFNLGELVANAPLASAAPLASLPTVLSRPLLEVAQGYVADLVRGLAADVREQVSSEVRLGVLAGRPPFEIMQRIGSKIDRGRFATIAQRAEVITRTETNRVMAIATDLRLGELKRNVPALRREWLATLDDRTRATHRVAHEQVREIGEPFSVGGHPLRFPGDPAGPASETINCRCRVVPYSANWRDVIEPTAPYFQTPAWYRDRVAAAS